MQSKRVHMKRPVLKVIVVAEEKKEKVEEEVEANADEAVETKENKEVEAVVETETVAEAEAETAVETVAEAEAETKMPWIRVVEKMKNTVLSDRICLLREPSVVQWLYGDTSFLGRADTITTKGALTAWLKKEEDAWGQRMMRIRRPDLKLDKQWTNRFGEYLCEEILILHGKTPFKPEKKNAYQPDVEAKCAIWEAKAQTYYTEGTAGEKILGCPFKYAEVPHLYGKPLRILCMGGAEKLSREKYGNLAGKCQSPQKRALLEAFRVLNIEYVGFTDFLEEWVNA